MPHANDGPTRPACSRFALRAPGPTKRRLRRRGGPHCARRAGRRCARGSELRAADRRARPGCAKSITRPARASRARRCSSDRESLFQGGQAGAAAGLAKSDGRWNSVGIRTSQSRRIDRVISALVAIALRVFSIPPVATSSRLADSRGIGDLSKCAKARRFLPVARERRPLLRREANAQARLRIFCSLMAPSDQIARLRDALQM
jgi:hypothetical protein